MQEANILSYFKERGLKVFLEGELLRVKPTSKITQDVRDFAKDNKAEIISVLKPPPVDGAVASEGEEVPAEGDTEETPRTGTLAESLEVIFERLIQEGRGELVEQLRYEYEERVSIIAESCKVSEEVAQLLAARETVKRWFEGS